MAALLWWHGCMAALLWLHACTLSARLRRDDGAEEVGPILQKLCTVPMEYPAVEVGPILQECAPKRLCSVTARYPALRY